MRTVSFASIVADYREQKLKEDLAGDWGSVVFYRLPAFAVAWAVAPLGVTATQLTVAGAVLVPLMALAAWFLVPAQAIAAVLALGFLFNVLDCADGTLARATGTSSLSGRYLDFTVDTLFRNTAYASIGLIADGGGAGGSFGWLAVGLGCGILSTYARVNRLYARQILPAAAGPGGSPRSAFDMVFSLLSGIDTLLPIIAFLAWQAGLLPAAMVWFLFYTLADAAVEVAGNYRKARDADTRGGV